MKNLILFLIFLFGCECMAFDIVYPKRKDVTINAESTFFIGSSNKPLKINGQEVPLHNSGGFAYVVTLNNGKNTFVVQDEDKREILYSSVIGNTYYDSMLLNDTSSKASLKDYELMVDEISRLVSSLDKLSALRQRGS